MLLYLPPTPPPLHSRFSLLQLSAYPALLRAEAAAVNLRAATSGAAVTTATPSPPSSSLPCEGAEAWLFGLVIALHASVAAAAPEVYHLGNLQVQCVTVKESDGLLARDT